jgi:hypothetical protein
MNVYMFLGLVRSIHAAQSRTHCPQNQSDRRLGSLTQNAVPQRIVIDKTGLADDPFA